MGSLGLRALIAIAGSLLIICGILTFVFVLEEAPLVKNKRLIHTRHQLIDTRNTPGVIHPDEETTFAGKVKKLSMNTLSYLTLSSPSVSISRGKSEDLNEEKSFFLHFDHAVSSNDEVLSTLKNMGIKLGHYMPQNTYLATATMEKIYEVKTKNIPGLLWIGEMPAHQKMHEKEYIRKHIEHHAVVHDFREAEGNRQCHKDSKNMGRKLMEFDDSKRRRDDIDFVIHVHVAHHDSKEELKQKVKNWEQEIKERIPNVKHVSLVVASNQKLALGIAGTEQTQQIADWLTQKGIVHWVEVKPPVITHNKYAAMLAQSYSKPTDKPIWSMGISGQGQVIGVGDTGVDSFHCFFYDPRNPVPYQRNMKQDIQETNHRKFAAFWEFMDKTDSPGGHGSHVSGIASGNALDISQETVKEYNALAKDSKLAFLDCGCDTDGGCTCPPDTQCECDLKPNARCPRKFGVVYLPLDLNEGYFPWFYSKGARITSNSWGTGYYKDFSFGYSTSSAEVDQFVHDHQDFLPVFAAGNSGGQFGYASLTSESESKNALVVGASMSSLESFQNLANFTDYTGIVNKIRAELYQLYCLGRESEELCEKAKAFTAADCCNDGGKCSPVTSKCCGNQAFSQFPTIGFRCCPKCIEFEMAHQPEHFSPNNLALFTARGPTMDGRIKPDVVTVGDKILSAKSSGTLEAHKCSTQQNAKDILLKHEGTSMAAPVAAGAALLVRQYFIDGYYPTGNKNPQASVTPSASLIKAMVIHSTQILTGYIYLMSKHQWWTLQYKPGQRFALRQSYLQGFGHIELAKALSKDVGLYIPNTKDKVISNLESQSNCFFVKSGIKPFRVTLVWTDPPSTPAAKLNLVNDLDLIIIGPDSKVYYGNGPQSVISSSRDEPDYVNNVEQVLFTKVTPGHYNVVVRGTSIPKGPQSYSLVLSGEIEPAHKCHSLPAAVTAELQKYQSMTVVFAIILIISVLFLGGTSLYFFMQHRSVTTGTLGHRQSAMAKTDQGVYFNLPETEITNNADLNTQN